MLLTDLALERCWLQVAGKEDVKRAIEDAIVVFATLARVPRVLHDLAIHSYMLRALGEDFRAIHDLLIELVGVKIWQLKEDLPNNLSLKQIRIRNSYQ